MRKFSIPSQAKGRARLADLAEATKAKAAELAADRPRFERLADNANAPRVVSSFNLFPTPPALAARVASAARLEDLAEGARILEPSAGLGALYLAARSALDLSGRSAAWSLVEIAAECAAELYRITATDLSARLIQGDFLNQSPAELGRFDRIVMNPPFSMGSDIRHVLHARQFLAPGGLLVSIVADGPRQRAKLEPIAESWQTLPAGSFKAEGTAVNTALVVIAAENS